MAKKRNQNDLVVINQTSGRIPRLPFQAIKERVLGTRYQLEVIFVAPAESKKLNKRYRRKNKPANVLSFPLSVHTGQIIICPAQARRDAGRYNRTSVSFLGFLLIHGLLHLKGYRHGSTMESEETRLGAKFLGK